MDTSVRGDHRNTNWNMVIEKCSQETKLFVAMGPVNAKGIVKLGDKEEEKRYREEVQKYIDDFNDWFEVTG